MNKEQYNTLARFAHGGVTKESAIGIFVTILLDKELLKTNSDVKTFVEHVFHIPILPYVARSRTLICAKICRFLITKEKKEINNFGAITLTYFERVFAAEDNSSNSKKKNTALSNMDLWISRMLKKDDK